MLSGTINSLLVSSRHSSESCNFRGRSGCLFESAELVAFQDYYDDDYGYHEDEYAQVPRSSGKRRQTSGSRSPGSKDADVTFMNLLKNKRQLGAILTGVGLLLTFMGMMLFFEGNLLRLGNICLISGIVLLVGPNNVVSFFMKKSRMQATIITSIGILLVFFGKPRIGLLVEIFGLLNLFGNMFPMLLSIARNLPVIGDIIRSFESAPAAGGGANKGPRYPAPRQPAAARRYDTPYDPDF